MIYNSWTVQPNILLRLLSVPHECWGCIDTSLGFPRIFNVKLCSWRVMAYHGGSHFLRVVLYAWYVLRYAHAHVIYLRVAEEMGSHT